MAKLSANGSALLFASFLGGSESEVGNDVALDAAGNVYVTGQTYSADFTTTPGAFDRVWGGDTMIFWGDAFVAKLDARRHGAAARPAGAAAGGAGAAEPGRGRRGRAAGDVRLGRRGGRGLVHDPGRRDLRLRRAADPEREHRRLAVHDQLAARRNGTGSGACARVNAEGTPGAWSAVRAITVQSTPPPPPPPVPGAPSLASPADGAQVTQPFTFDWGDVADAAWYVIEADDSASFAAPLVWAATTTPSQLATNSLPNGTLFWRVRAFNSDGVGGPLSAVRTVAVQSSAPPSGSLPAPALLSPASDARFSPGQSITFDWGDVAGAASYTIQIDDSESFSAPQTANQTLAFSQLTTSTLPTRRMWWRVRANDGSGGAGAWSAARRFEVKN